VTGQRRSISDGKKRQVRDDCYGFQMRFAEGVAEAVKAGAGSPGGGQPLPHVSPTSPVDLLGVRQAG
jgi:hypothetical protein